VKRSITVELSRFAVEALAREKEGASVRAATEMGHALRCYLADRESGLPAWPYPGFLRGSKLREGVPLEINVDEDLWRAFEAESVRQGVVVQQLAEHAALYFVAEVDAGRITQRILDDLEALQVGTRSLGSSRGSHHR